MRTILCLAVIPLWVVAYATDLNAQTATNPAAPPLSAASPSGSEAATQPPTPAPTGVPPAPTGAPPPPPYAGSRAQTAPPQATPAQPSPAQPSTAGQWVYTAQYGWAWMPYDEKYVYIAPGPYPFPYEYVFFGGVWDWVAAPWIWGRGPRPWYGFPGPGRFAWHRRPGFYQRGGMIGEHAPAFRRRRFAPRR